MVLGKNFRFKQYILRRSAACEVELFENRFRIQLDAIERKENILLLIKIPSLLYCIGCNFASFTS